MLLSKTPAKTENKYTYRYAVYLNHEKFISNAEPDLNENNVGSAVGSTDRVKK